MSNTELLTMEYCFASKNISGTNILCDHYVKRLMAKTCTNNGFVLEKSHRRSHYYIEDICYSSSESSVLSVSFVLFAKASTRALASSLHNPCRRTIQENSTKSGDSKTSFTGSASSSSSF